MEKQEILDAFTLYFSGAAEMKNEKEMKWKELGADITIEFPTHSPKLAVTRYYSSDSKNFYREMTYKNYKYLTGICCDIKGRKCSEDIVKKYNTTKTFWYKNGKKEEEVTTNKKGNIIGKFINWHKNGIVANEYEVGKNGDLVGDLFERYKSGQLARHEKYENKKRVYLATWYDNGQMSRQCADNKTEEWDREGNKIFEQYYENDWLITKHKSKPMFCVIKNTE